MTQTKGLKRDTIDKFYTDTKVVTRCIMNIKKHLKISKKNDIVIEPSAGNGAFINQLKKLCDNHLFMDIKPEHPDIIQQDFLEFDDTRVHNQLTVVKDDTRVHNQLTVDDTRVHIIGNPPFGRQSSLAIKFIKKATTFCESISFILPRSFKKDSLKKYFPLRFHLIYQEDLPRDSFRMNGDVYDVDTVFQIWKRMDIDREDVVKVVPLSFMFVKKTEAHDISFRRVGVYAGKIDTTPNTKEKSIQSHYFIKFLNNQNINEMIEKLNKIKFNHNNTVGPRSISKQELIIAFNQVLD